MFLLFNQKLSKFFIFKEINENDISNFIEKNIESIFVEQTHILKIESIRLIKKDKSTKISKYNLILNNDEITSILKHGSMIKTEIGLYIQFNDREIFFETKEVSADYWNLNTVFESFSDSKSIINFHINKILNEKVKNVKYSKNNHFFIFLNKILFFRLLKKNNEFLFFITDLSGNVISYYQEKANKTNLNDFSKQTTQDLFFLKDFKKNEIPINELHEIFNNLFKKCIYKLKTEYIDLQISQDSTKFKNF